MEKHISLELNCRNCRKDNHFLQKVINQVYTEEWSFIRLDPVTLKDRSWLVKTPIDIEIDKNFIYSTISIPGLNLEKISIGSYARSENSIKFSVDFAEFSQLQTPADKEKYAQRFLELAKKWYPVFKPEFGYIDISGFNTITSKEINQCIIKHLYWVNFFGPSYIKKYNKEFLLDIPAYKTEEIGDGIMVQLSEKFTNKSGCPKFTELKKYMAQKKIDLKEYKPKLMYL
ncbi:MAG: hypothetical protein ACD_58C00027G0002 [uncultured bacterium]|nr:MAG: hypothetical protein ACD_58C00027G0002 [uncultured bacterium]